jgi:ethanolamine ammonia-lyase small subunit
VSQVPPSESELATRQRPPGPHVRQDAWRSLRELTPARIALGRAGGSLPTAAHLDFQLAHARARDAVHSPLDVSALGDGLRAEGHHVLTVHSAAAGREEYLQRPDLGRRLDEASRDRLRSKAPAEPVDVVFALVDGLSPVAVESHAPPLLELVVARLRQLDWTVGPIVLVEQGRVAIGDEIGSLLGAGQVAVLIGERPGLSSPDSLGVYLTHDPRPGRRDSDRNCVSNIRPEGLGYNGAAHTLCYLMTEARRRGLTGVHLKDDAPSLAAPAEALAVEPPR